jgi:hypothetical protein
MNSKSYPYSKSIMLNAVYDAADTLGVRIERTNSDRGTILAVFGDGRKFRIMLETVYPDKNTKITLLPLDEECMADAELSQAFF